MASCVDSGREGTATCRPRVLRMAVWRWPVILAALSVFGLLSALLGQGGIWWFLSWVALATPLAVIVRRPMARFLTAPVI